MLKAIQSESDLRAWLRAEWHEKLWGPLIWVEAAMGGTDGAPDVFVPIPGQGFVAVELKYWPLKSFWSKKKTNFGLPAPRVIQPKMRASQRRLHRLIGLTGYRSVVLSYLGFGEIGLAVGHRIAEKLDAGTVHRRNLDINEFRNLLTLGSFWKEEQYAGELARPTSYEQLRKGDRKRTRRAKG